MYYSSSNCSRFAQFLDFTPSVFQGQIHVFGSQGAAGVDDRGHRGGFHHDRMRDGRSEGLGERPFKAERSCVR